MINFQAHQFAKNGDKKCINRVQKIIFINRDRKIAQKFQ